MGQYHTIYNKTKKEYFSIGGAKLLEKAFNPLCTSALMVLLCNSNGRGGGDLYVQKEYDKKYNPLPLSEDKQIIQDAVDAIQGRWAGDSIVIQGDYAERGDPAYIGKKALEGYNDITGMVVLALGADDELAAQLKSEMKFSAHIKAMITPSG